MLVEVNDEVRASLIRDTAPEDLVAAVDDLDLDDLADILDDLPEAVTSEVLRSLDRQDRERLARVLSYPGRFGRGPDGPRCAHDSAGRDARCGTALSAGPG